MSLAISKIEAANGYPVSEECLKIVKDKAKRAVAVAGPGTGKTTTIVTDIAYKILNLGL